MDQIKSSRAATRQCQATPMQLPHAQAQVSARTRILTNWLLRLRRLPSLSVSMQVLGMTTLAESCPRPSVAAWLLIIKITVSWPLVSTPPHQHHTGSYATAGHRLGLLAHQKRFILIKHGWCLFHARSVHVLHRLSGSKAGRQCQWMLS